MVCSLTAAQDPVSLAGEREFPSPSLTPCVLTAGDEVEIHAPGVDADLVQPCDSSPLPSVKSAVFKVPNKNISNDKTAGSSAEKRKRRNDGSAHAQFSASASGFNRFSPSTQSDCHRGRAKGRGRGRGSFRAADQGYRAADQRYRSPLDNLYPGGGDSWPAPKRHKPNIRRTVYQAPQGNTDYNNLQDSWSRFQGYPMGPPMHMGMPPQWLPYCYQQGFQPQAPPPPPATSTSSAPHVVPPLHTFSVAASSPSVEVSLGQGVDSNECREADVSTGYEDYGSSEESVLDVNLQESGLLPLQSGLSPPRVVVASDPSGNRPTPVHSSIAPLPAPVFRSPPLPPPRASPSTPQDRPWTELVQMIESFFPTEVGARTPTRRAQRVQDDVSTNDQLSTRQRLPLYPAVSSALDFTAQEVASSSSSKTKAAAPLPKGKFPQVDSKRETLPPSSLPEFNLAAPRDASLEGMGPSGKSIAPPKVRLSDESLKTLEKDQRVALSSLSYAMWTARAASHLLASEGQSNRDIIDLITATRRWLLTVADRLVVAFSTLLLIRRDGYLQGMDSLVNEAQTSSLRSAAFSSPSLFGPQTTRVATELAKAREVAQPTQAIRAISRMAKQLVTAKSAPPPAPPKAAPSASRPAANAARPAPARAERAPTSSEAAPSKRGRRRRRRKGPQAKGPE